MAAGLATLDVLASQNLIENAAQKGARLLSAFREMAERYELVKDVRGKGLMLGIEFGSPHTWRLKSSWKLVEAASTGLFCQLVVIPLLIEHKLLTQVAGHGSHTVKLLPPLIISEADCDWIEGAFDAVIADAHRVPGAVWTLGKTLAENALAARVPG
jgi:ornithine--oxo-acid transaminase